MCATCVEVRVLFLYHLGPELNSHARLDSRHVYPLSHLSGL